MSQNIDTKKPKRDRIGVILYVLYVLALIFSIVLILGLLNIQLFFHSDEKIESELTPKNTLKVLEPERGDILDCNGRLLAISCPSYQFYMDCTVQKGVFDEEQEQKWHNKAYELAKGLAKEFPGTSADEFHKMIVDGRKNGKKYVKIGTPVDHNVYNRLKKLPLFNEDPNKGGCIVEPSNIRQYPYGSLARRTIGFVRDNKTLVKNTHIGLEGKFDYVLHGEEGREYLRKTDEGRVRNNDSSYVAAIDGNDLRTTINIDYQEIADNALRKLIEEEEDLEAACLVLMETKTGAIRAMVNLSREKKGGEFFESQNLAIGRTAEPGSVFKTVTLMSVLNDGYIKSLEETLPATNGHVDGTSITDSHIPDFARQHGTNRISILDGFKISSNYVFASLAVNNYGKTGKTDKFLSNIYTYKLGEAFDFDLDGLQTPVIPNPSTRYWTNTDLASMAYGYSTQETPLHILTFYNAIANKGRMMKPYLVESIEKNGKVVKKRGQSVLNAAVCSKAVADTITRALKAVTEDGGTAARRLKGAKAEFAGKTGTSFGTFPNGRYEDADGKVKYQGTMVGFFPADDPQYSAICVVYSYPTRKSYQGGGIPARAIRDMIDEIYNIDPYFREKTSR